MKKYLIDNIFTRVFSYYLIVKNFYMKIYAMIVVNIKKKLLAFFCVYILSQKFTCKIIIIALQLQNFT